ncbi:endogenous retrovirus group K member 25 Pol protein-like protein [Turdus rufiventris]|nr:endogenous retrovirus group K member 25 Pol protein-like protein [Turdus rufiventris]
MYSVSNTRARGGLHQGMKSHQSEKATRERHSTREGCREEILTSAERKTAPSQNRKGGNLGLLSCNLLASDQEKPSSSTLKTCFCMGKRPVVTMGHESGNGFLVGVTVALTTPKLTWKTDKPVWVDQWPLERKKLSALKTLVKEQLQKGHIKPTNSPWNFPVFVIWKKTSGQWRLLHDLWKLNEIMEEMGPLQQGLPSLTRIPREWPLVIIDLKDCFFSIPLHPDDAHRMAFSVPSLNREEPLERYHWVVLPQGLKNSPTICQWYVARALAPARKKYPESSIIHYMDDLLIAALKQQELQQVRDRVIEEVQKAGLEISTSKIQEIVPSDGKSWSKQ